jgi:glutamine synthetase type III
MQLEVSHELLYLNGLHVEMISEIKAITAQRLDLVKRQLSDLLSTAAVLEKRGLQVESDKSQLLFELRTELVNKQKKLETQMADTSRVDAEEFEFFVKLGDLE